MVWSKHIKLHVFGGLEFIEFRHSVTGKMYCGLTNNSFAFIYVVHVVDCTEYQMEILTLNVYTQNQALVSLWCFGRCFVYYQFHHLTNVTMNIHYEHTLEAIKK